MECFVKPVLVLVPVLAGVISHRRFRRALRKKLNLDFDDAVLQVPLALPLLLRLTPSGHPAAAHRC